jgi:hypothetical protein
MPAVLTESVAIGIGGGRRTEADLVVPDRALGLVVFAHGSGSSRFSSRNRAVAESLHARRMPAMVCAAEISRGSVAVRLHTIRDDRCCARRNSDMKMLVFVLAGALIGIVVASVVVPPALAWYTSPGGLPQGAQIQALVQISEVIRYATSKLIRAQLIGALIGGGAGLLIGFVLDMRSRREVAA